MPAMGLQFLLMQLGLYVKHAVWRNQETEELRTETSSERST